MPQKKYIVRLTPEEREVCREVFGVNYFGRSASTILAG